MNGPALSIESQPPKPSRRESIPLRLGKAMAVAGIATLVLNGTACGILYEGDKVRAAVIRGADCHTEANTTTCDPRPLSELTGSQQQAYEQARSDMDADIVLLGMGGMVGSVTLTAAAGLWVAGNAARQRREIAAAKPAQVQTTA